MSICVTQIIAHVQPQAFLLISLVENNQHHCSLLWLLIGLLPDLPNRSLGGTDADTLTLGEKGRSVQKELPVCEKHREMRQWIIQPSGYPDTDLLFQTCRGRSVSRRLSVAHELIAAKSNSQSTRWANWVPVFVRDDGEVILPSLRRPGCCSLADFVMSVCPPCRPQRMRQSRCRLQLTRGNCSHHTLIGRLCVYRRVREFPSLLFFSANKWRTSSMSLSTQQDMISFVNTDCYKSPPVQTCALFAKLL